MAGDVWQSTIVCWSILLSSAAPTAAAMCGKGFTEAGSHGAFYNQANAGRLAYAPLAKTADEGKSAQIFCIFNDNRTYVIYQRPNKLVFVFNNMRASGEPQANAFLGLRFVRVGTSMVAIETWKNQSEIWERKNGTGFNPYQSGSSAMRDKFLLEVDRAADETAFRTALGINIFDTTRPGANGLSYSAWERRTELPKRETASDDSINFSIIAFENREEPPSFLSRGDRKRRVTFEISPGEAKRLLIYTYGPPLLSIERKEYSVEFKQ